MPIQSKAIYLCWNGSVLTKLKFATFFAGDHTIMAWFMPQYPFAYAGPLFADSSRKPGNYLIGQGNYRSGDGGYKKKGNPVFMVRVGGKEALYLVPEFKAKKWHHIAIVRQSNVFKFYLNGVRQKPFGKDSEGKIHDAAADVVLPQSFIPAGTLRFGRSNPPLNNWQSYGLLDDVAVFNGALSIAEINAIREQKQLNGSEPGLLAAWVFDERTAGELPLPAVLDTWHSRSKRAYLVPVSANRSNTADAKRFADPAFMGGEHLPLRLPFPPLQSWRVSQGFNSPGGSHNGNAAFTWDFVLTDIGPEEPPIFASASGEVVSYLHDGEPKEEILHFKAGREPNNVAMKIGPEACVRYLHLKKHSLAEEIHGGIWDKDISAFVMPTGKEPWLNYYSFVGKVGKGADHLHMGVENGFKGSITIPAAFTDYEVRQADGSWKSVARGIPQPGDVVRNPPFPKFVRSSLQPGSAVARRANLLEVVATDAAGRVWLAQWQPNTYERNWDRWRPVLADIGLADGRFVHQISPACVVARDAGKLDVFVAGEVGKTYTGAWDQQVDDGLWRGWMNILKGALPIDGVVTAVSRAADQLDVFHVSHDGRVYTAAWNQQAADGAWQGWWPIQEQVTKPGAPVAAVAREPNKLDIFVAGKDGKVYTAAWAQNQVAGKWQGWRSIGDLAVPVGAPISVVSRGPNNLDIFVVGQDGGVYTAAWAKHAAGGEWPGWRRVQERTAKPGTPVAAVTREPHNLDIFVVGSDNKVYTAAWDRHVADGQWRGWRVIGKKSAKPKSAVAAVSREPLKLDIFIVGSDGKIYTAAWDHQAAEGEWQGWWPVGV